MTDLVPIDALTSLRRKLVSYCDFYQRYRRPENFPAGLDVAAAEYKLTQLRAVSKELNVHIRESMTLEEIAVLIQMMRDAGVAEADLPKLKVSKQYGSPQP
ncbi:hypothetical protein J2W24_006352 [Variovorax boronicumulans]|uniref:hypothetical protein n=1 Tax=Variovorax boronicumulans TaxID=436515 RepID=UPI00277E3459|nr:hypothetical protein [Variovorax boronicumulans]MDP9920670.1 hypothetical protein [Variovorax boronicumulans]